MKIKSIKIKNFRSLKNISINASDLNIFIGKNDVGKSNILKALELFLTDESCKDSDFNNKCSEKDKIEISISFTDLPNKIKIDNAVSNLKEEQLLNRNNELEIIKEYEKHRHYPETYLATYSYYDKDIRGLILLKRQELLELLKKKKINYRKEYKKLRRKSRSITNADRRKVLRDYAKRRAIPLKSIILLPDRKILKPIEKLLPEIMFFSASENLDVKKDTFQDTFKREVITPFKDNTKVNEIEKEIKGDITHVLDKVSNILKEKVDSVEELIANPQFNWINAIRFDIIVKDKLGVKTPLQNRGSGIQRLLMLSYFEYLIKNKKNTILSIEEPESYLHPEQQRDLLNSMIEKSEGQIFITTHSPVFTSASGLDTKLVKKDKEGKTIIESITENNVHSIIKELGIKPRDIFEYNGIVFVEDKYGDDIFEEFMKKLSISKNICFIGTEGFTNIAYYANAKIASKKIIGVFAIFDGDTEIDETKEKQKDKVIRKLNLTENEIITLNKNSLEDYLLIPRAIKEAFSNLSMSRQEIRDFLEKSKSKKNKKIVLDKLFREGRLDKYKESHGIKIAKAMKKDEIDPEIKNIISRIVVLTK